MVERSFHVGHGLSLLALAALTACGSAQKPDDDGIAALLAAPPATASAEADAPPKPADTTPAKGDEDLNDAQKEQMEVALRRGGDKAANCSSVVPDALKGDGEVKVTFDGKKGRAVDVAVPAPWAGTDAESCIKRAFVGEIIVPFPGTLEVPYGIHVGPKKVDPAKDKGAKDKGAKGKTQKK